VVEEKGKVVVVEVLVLGCKYCTTLTMRHLFLSSVTRSSQHGCFLKVKGGGLLVFAQFTRCSDGMEVEARDGAALALDSSMGRGLDCPRGYRCSVTQVLCLTSGKRNQMKTDVYLTASSVHQWQSWWTGGGRS